MQDRLDLGSYDYVIVGAGSSGCVLANRLSADASKRVLLLEAGGSDNYHWIHIPVGYLYCMGNPQSGLSATYPKADLISYIQSVIPIVIQLRREGGRHGVTEVFFARERIDAS